MNLEVTLPSRPCGCDKYGECRMHEEERERDENRCHEMIMMPDGSAEYRCIENTAWEQIIVPRTDDRELIIRDSEITPVCDACKQNNEEYFSDPDTDFMVFFIRG